MELYISRNGTKISKIKECFGVRSDEKDYILSSEKIESIVLESECSITSGVIKLAFEKDIPIIVTDIYGNVMGQFYKIDGTKNGKLKKEQYKFFSSDDGIEIAKEWIIEKILNQRIHLEKLLKRRKKSLEVLSIFNNHIRKIETSLIQEGFDTTVGILHVEGNNKLPLLYDFIEKYRILAFEGTFDLFNNRMIKDEYFTGDIIKSLTIDGKYTISNYFNSILKTGREYRGKRYTIDDIIKFELKKLKNLILEVNI